MADGPVAAPAVAASVRNKISDHAFQDTTDSTEKKVAKVIPSTNTRLCPQRSPAFPYAGPTTPNASIGAVITQLKMNAVVFRSFAMVSSETTSKVIGNDTVNRQVRITMSVAHDRVMPTLRTTRCAKSVGHGTTPTSSTPAARIVELSRCSCSSRCSFIPKRL